MNIKTKTFFPKTASVSSTTHTDEFTNTVVAFLVSANLTYWLILKYVEKPLIHKLLSISKRANGVIEFLWLSNWFSAFVSVKLLVAFSG